MHRLKQKSAALNKGLLRTWPFVVLHVRNTQKRTQVSEVGGRAAPGCRLDYHVASSKSLLCQLRETNTIDYRRNNKLGEDGAVSWNRKLQDKMCFKVQGHKGVTELMSFPHPYV